jgi:cation transport regulator ChaB
MATEIGELRARLVAEASQMKQEIKAVKKELTDLGEEGKKTSRSFVDLSGVLEKIGANTDQLKKIEAVLKSMDPSRLEKGLQDIVNELRKMGIEAKQIEKIEQELKDSANQARKTEQSLDGVRGSIGAIGSAATALGGGAAFVGLTRTITTLAYEAHRLSMSYSGLAEVARATNVDVEAAVDLAEELANRWGLNKAVLADTVKTYLTAGLTLEQTRDIIVATADAAVYNREAHLQWDEAIRQVAQGIKMGNSNLTDAAGITTNLSVMYERYAKTIGKTAATLTEAEKIQAAYNGIMQESAMFAGNADSAMTGYTGTQATFNQTLAEARVELGEAFLPVLQDLMEMVTPVIRDFAAFADGNKEVVAGIAAATTAVTGFIAVIGALSVAFLALNAAMGPVGLAIVGIGALATGTLAYSAAADAAAGSVWKFAQNQEELNQKLSESPLNRTVADVKNLQADIDKLNELLERRRQLEEQIEKISTDPRSLAQTRTVTPEIQELGKLRQELEKLDDQLAKLGINTPDDAPKVIEQLKEQLDGAIPALNQIEAESLRAAATQVQHIDKVKQLVKQYEHLDQQSKLSANQKAQLTEVVKQLTQEYPGLISELDEEGRWHIRNKNLIEEMIKAEKESVDASTEAARKRLEARKKETEAKLILAQQQVKALMAAEGVDFEDTAIGKRLPGELGKGIDAIGDIILHGLAKKASDNVNQYQMALNEIDKQLQAITSGSLDKFLPKPGSDAPVESEKKKQGKTLDQIQHEQYQASLKWIEYKKDLDQISEQEELAALQRLEARYKKNADIRMDVEVRIYKLRQQMQKTSFEASQEWIEQEERRMTLAGESEEKIAQMKIDAWTRVRNRYAKDSELYKQADTQLYNARITLIKLAEKVEQEAAKEREKRTKEVTRSVIDAIEKQKKAELDALDERRREIQKFYDDQLEAVDDSERLKERNDLIAEMEKYRYATSEKGQKHFQELQEKLRQMDVEDHKRNLEKQRDQELENLDQQKRDIESWYDDLRNLLEDYSGDAIGIYKMIEDERFKAFAKTNDRIKSELNNLAETYASIMSGGPVQTSASSASIIAQMQANSAQWMAASPARRKELEAANQALGASIGATYVPSEGRWYRDGKPLYHTGGIADFMNFRSANTLMPDEIDAILKRGEVTMTEQQIGTLVAAVSGASSGGSRVHIEKVVGVEMNNVALEDDIDLRAYERTGGNEATEILRKQLSGGG